MDVDAPDYKRFAAQLRQSPKGVKASLRKRIREAGKPLAQSVVREGAASMPSGVRARYADAGNARLSQTATSVRIILGRKGAYIGGPNRSGVIRHPLYGNRGKWFGTPVPAQSWSQAFDDSKQDAVDTVAKVLDDLIGDIT